MISLRGLSFTILSLFWGSTLFPMQSAAEENLIVGYQAITPSQTPLWVASDRGLFAKYGLNVRLVFLRSGTTAIQALIAGDINLIHVGGPPFVNGVVAGAPVVMVASTVNRMLFQFYGAPGVKGPKDLIGKKVGVGGIGGGADLAAKLALKHIGLDPDRDVTYLQIGTDPLRLLALRSGQIQAAALLPPNTFIAQKENLPLLVDLAATDINYVNTGLASSKAFVKSHRQSVMNFLKAYCEGIAFSKRHKQQTMDILFKYLRTSDIKAVSYSYDVVVGKIMSERPYPNWTGIKTVLESLSIKNYPSPASFLDDTFIKELDQGGFIDRLYNKGGGPK